MTLKDPVVEEVRKIRADMAAECGFDFDTFSRYLFEIQSTSPRKPLESIPKRKLKKDSSKQK
jgi:hypothetical protein